MINLENIKIGFIGQGWIGKNYADDFENRGYKIVRYGLEEEFNNNKDKIKECQIVFIAVPTPTDIGSGFDFSAVESALHLLVDNTISVIKSTLSPGTTDILQKKFPNVFVFHSPEFLREVTAAFDAAHPARNIIGITELNELNIKKAKQILEVLPKAKYEKIMLAKEAELIKYIGNCFLYQKVVFFNQMYDLAQSLGLDYENVRSAVVEDIRIGESHTKVLHASGHDADNLGRGAGGHCFIKDFETLINLYKYNLPDDNFGINSLISIRDKNNELLVKSNKDIDLLSKVIGDLNKYK